MKKTLYFLELTLRRISHISTFLLGVFFKTINVLFLPVQVDIDQCSDSEEQELDEIAALWNKLWSRVNEELSLGHECQTKFEKLSLSMTRRVGVELRSVKRAILSHSCNDSASSQMLRCYRNAGEPAVNDISLALHFANKTQSNKYKKSTIRHFVL